MSNHFQYTILPSAAQLGELPSYLAYQALISGKTFSAIGGYLAGFITIPISIAFTPVAIVADCIIGIAEAAFMTFKGAKKEDIKEVLFKKIVVSPIQQTISAIVKLACFILLPVAWTLSYVASQGVIMALPNSLNHKRLNIFIHGGITDKGSTKTVLDEEDKIPSSSSKDEESKEQEDPIIPIADKNSLFQIDDK